MHRAATSIGANNAAHDDTHGAAFKAKSTSAALEDSDATGGEESIRTRIMFLVYDHKDRCAIEKIDPCHGYALECAIVAKRRAALADDRVRGIVLTLRDDADVFQGAHRG